MPTRSLATRLFLASAIWTLLVLPITAFVLVSLYRDAVERSFDARLNQYLDYLITVTSPERGADINEPTSVGEPLFSLPLSGWYWQITPQNGGRGPLTSESLVNERLTLPSASKVPAIAGARKTYTAGPDGQTLRLVERDIAFIGGEERRLYSYAVAGDGEEIAQEAAAFSTMLIAALGVLGAGLLFATFFQVRWGLAPLRAIGVSLAAIRAGEAKELIGQLPDEIAPLQVELNALIRSNEEIISRARMHVGNLAHALKTPLSVITNEARDHDDPFAAKVAEQALLMGDYVSHHLDRARVAAQLSLVGGVTPIAPALARLVKTVQHIHNARRLEYSVACPGDARFRGESQDFEEMLGNLLDNAAKWATSKVAIEVGGTRLADRPAWDIVIDDDGPGLDAEERRIAVIRGRRLDETKPGSGLGLSIVADLAHLYDGKFTLSEAPHGGLRAQLVMPAA